MSNVIETLLAQVAEARAHAARYLENGTCYCGGGRNHRTGPHSALLQALESGASPAWMGDTSGWPEMQAVLALSPAERAAGLARLREQWDDPAE